MSKKEKLSQVFDNTIGKKIDNFDGRYEAYKKYNIDSFTEKYGEEVEEVIDKLGIVLTEEQEKEIVNHIFSGYQKTALVNPDFEVDKQYIKNIVVNYHMLNTPNPLFKMMGNIILCIWLLWGIYKLSTLLYMGTGVIYDINTLMVYSTYAMIIYGTWKNHKYLEGKYERYKKYIDKLKWTIV